MTHLWPQGEPLQIWGAVSAPEGFLWHGGSHGIVEVTNRWRVHTRWWAPGEALWREYWKVVTDSGLLCLVYRDLPEGNWFMARLYD